MAAVEDTKHPIDKLRKVVTRARHLGSYLPNSEGAFLEPLSSGMDATIEGIAKEADMRLKVLQDAESRMGPCAQVGGHRRFFLGLSRTLHATRSATEANTAEIEAVCPLPGRGEGEPSGPPRTRARARRFFVCHSWRVCGAGVGNCFLIPNSCVSFRG